MRARRVVHTLFLLLAGILAMAATASAQANLTPEQLRMLQQLPAGQRAQLMQSLGIDQRQLEQQQLEFPQTVLPPPSEMEPVEQEPRLRPGDTVIVKLELLPEAQRRERQLERERTRGANGEQELDVAQQQVLDRRQQQAAERELAELETQFEEQVARNPALENIRGARTYELDRAGAIVFPGVASVLVGGLNEEQAARRLEAEPNLSLFTATVTLLPLEPFGAEALEPFGYALFKGTPVTFAPATDVPVPAEYVVGPGDQVRVQLYGNKNADYTLVVSRDGSLNFPEIGPINVAGLRFGDMRELIRRQVEEQMIGVTVAVTMGELRSIRVFVLGDVNRPGSFTVSGLSTMTNALFVSGGVTEVGSLRRVQLKRKGQTVQELDLYDLLLKGDNGADVRLQPDDVIFVPPKGATVAVDGEVQRPAIYELKSERSVGDAVELAGGLTSMAFANAVRLERVDPTGGRTVLTVNLTQDASRSQPLRNGDVIVVDPVLDLVSEGVELSGQVQRPGHYEWRPGMRLTDLLPSVAALKPGADRNYLLVERRADLSGPLEVYSADLARALAEPSGPHNLALMERDVVHVFDLGSGRRKVLDPIMEELQLQATINQPSRQVSVGGMVRAPGIYPLEDDMRVSDLVRAGGNLTDSAYGLKAEITRYSVADGIRRIVELIDVDLGAALAGDTESNLRLASFDYLNVKQVSQWQRQGTVELLGEVHFPGRYPIEPGETLSHVVERAGGLTEFAFPEGSVFLREDLREREQQQIERLIDRLESDLASLTLQAMRSGVGAQQGRVDQSLSVGQALLSQLRDTEAAGRLVIDLPGLLSGGVRGDVLVKDGDRLVVPERTQEVSVIGEVQYVSSHLFTPDVSRTEYINLSGGLTANADKDRIYVVRANGEVVADGGGSKWFRRSGNLQMRPGDTIVVPLDVDRVPKLALWQSSTTIIYNLAVAAAAVGSL